MRNLLEYPVTADEITSHLRRSADEISKELRCGDMRPLLLKAAADSVDYEKTVRQRLERLLDSMTHSSTELPDAVIEEVRQIAALKRKSF